MTIFKDSHHFSRTLGSLWWQSLRTAITSAELWAVFDDNLSRQPSLQQNFRQCLITMFNDSAFFERTLRGRFREKDIPYYVHQFMTYHPLKRMLQALPGQNLPKKPAKPIQILTPTPPTTSTTHVRPIPSPCRDLLEDLEGCRLGPTESASTKATKARSHVAYLIYTSGSTGTPKGARPDWSAGGVVGVGWSWFPTPKKKQGPPPPKKKIQNPTWGMFTVLPLFFWVCFSDFKSSKLLDPWRKNWDFLCISWLF